MRYSGRVKFRREYQDDPDPPGVPDPGPRRGAPWDAQAHEPAHAFEWFREYLHSPTDSLAAYTAAHPSRPVREVYSLACAWAWRERRAAMHAYVAREAVSGLVETAQDRARAHAAILSEARQWAVSELQRMRAEHATMKPNELLAYAKTVIELERLIDGEPGARVAVDLSGASPEALEALEKALVQIERPDRAPEGGLN